MCWVSGNIPELKIAKKDIKVKKILLDDNNILRSPVYINCIWKQGVIQEVNHFPGCIKYDSCYIKNNGFHSCKKISYKNGYWYSDSKYSTKMFQIGDSERVFNAIIPKGSKYYLNEYGEFVSDKLIII